MKYLLAYLLLLAGQPLYSQNDSLLFSKDTELKEGFYISFADFRTNDPLPAARVVSKYDKNDMNFFTKVLENGNVTYLDSSKKENKISSSKLWGFYRNHTLYINYGRDFNRVAVVGAICHFIAYLPVYPHYADPFTYNNNVVNPQYAMDQYVMEFRSGKILPFNVSTMEALLQRDGDLHQEFESLGNKQKRNSIFIYLRKFDERNPVYFSSKR